MNKRTLIVTLVGLNLALLGALILGSYSLPAAYAQRAGVASNFVAITARANTDYDALYMVDLGQRRLHCFVPNRDHSGNVQYIGSRDLKQDFSR